MRRAAGGQDAASASARIPRGDLRTARVRTRTLAALPPSAISAPYSFARVGMAVPKTICGTATVAIAAFVWIANTLFRTMYLALCALAKERAESAANLFAGGAQEPSGGANRTLGAPPARKEKTKGRMRMVSVPGGHHRTGGMATTTNSEPCHLPRKSSLPTPLDRRSARDAPRKGSGLSTCTSDWT